MDKCRNVFWGSLALGLVLATSFSVYAQQVAPSFECSMASAPVETLICGDVALARLDAKMARTYKRIHAALTSEEQQQNLRTAQRAWLAQRLKECGIPKKAPWTSEQTAAIACLKTSYEDRIAALSPEASQGSERYTVSAHGQQETVFYIDHFGRYSVVGASAQGTSLQLVDKASGPGEVYGNPGQTDGRFDGYFDVGAYKAITRSDPAGEGDATLQVVRFQELETGPPRQLVDSKLVSTDLDDFQTRSFWLNLTQKKNIVLEAAGRNLKDLGIWREGAWLVNAPLAHTTYDTVAARPLAGLQLSMSLEPGLYKFSFYGGPSQPWSEEAKTGETAHPLYIRLGVPQLAEAGRQMDVASPFGVDRFRVPSDTNFFRLSLPTPDEAKLSVSQSPFSVELSQDISLDSREPVAELTAGKGEKYVSVTREPGKPYGLQHFKNARTYTFGANGAYWLGIITSGFKEDTPGTTAILSRHSTGRRATVVQAKVLELDLQHEFKRRFNLDGPVDLMVNIKEAGKYKIAGQGVSFTHVFRLKASRPRGYQEPEMKTGDGVWDLAQGLYSLEIKPGQGHGGVFDLSLASVSGGMRPTAPINAVTWPNVLLASSDRYQLERNSVAGEETGVVLRKLPLDPTEGLPVNLDLGARINVPILVKEAGTLRVLEMDGQSVPVMLDGISFERARHLDPGKYTLSASNPQSELLRFQVSFDLDSLSEAVPLPALPSATLENLPSFPVLEPSVQSFADANTKTHPIYRFHVSEPALYRLETTGLLNTQGALRTRVVTALERKVANGMGRNFLIQRYLDRGEYQIDITTQGKSAGRLGVKLSATPLVEGGMLPLGETVRATLEAGKGIVYAFSVEKSGLYDVGALGLNKTFAVRLEDADGWPIVKPGAQGDFSLHLDAGHYRLIVLPQALDSRVVTTLKPSAVRPVWIGHGPHALPLNSRVKHVWNEPEDGQARTPDQWRFTLAAPATVNIDLDEAMLGRLHGPNGQNTLLKGIWKGPLEKGEYHLDVVSRRENNRLPYGLSLNVEQLLVGMDVTISSPKSLDISLADEGLVELTSKGTRDVHARLYDANGNLVAFNDDRENDWNFLITQSLTPGHYRLQVDGVADHVTVSLRQPFVHQGQELSVPSTVKINSDDLVTFPLALPKSGDLFQVAVRSEDSVGLTLEQNLGEGWQGIGAKSGSNPKMLFSRGQGEFRLRVWPLVKRKSSFVLNTAIVIPQDVNEADLAQGLSLASKEGGEALPEVFKVTLDRPGLFAANQNDDSVFWGIVPGAALGALTAPTFFADRTLFIAMGQKPAAQRVAAGRLVLQAGSAARVNVRGQGVHRLELASGGVGPVLLTATSNLGQPMMRLDGVLSGRGKVMAAAVALSGSGISNLDVWNGEGEVAQAHEDMSLALTRTDFSPALIRDVDFGVEDLTFPGRGAIDLALPRGDKFVRLALPPDTVAVLVDGKTILTTVVTENAAKVHAFETDATRVLVLHKGQEQAQASVLVSKMKTAPAVLEPGGGYRTNFVGEGSLHLQVKKPSTPKTIVLYGKKLSGRFVGEDGHMASGRNLDVASAGWLIVEHGPGSVAVTFGDATSSDATSGMGMQNEYADSFGGFLGTGTTLSSSKLSFQAPAPTGTAQVTVDFDDAVLVQVLATAAAKMSADFTHDVSKTQFFEEEAVWNILAPSGQATLRVESLAPGGIRFTAMPVQKITDGLGPLITLAPGDGRAFFFDVPAQTDVGVGVASSTGAGYGRLLDAKGEELARGVVAMRRLPKGRYFWLVQAPSDGEVMDVKPVLVGSVTPDAGPPQSEIEKYLKLSGLKIQQSGSRQ